MDKPFWNNLTFILPLLPCTHHMCTGFHGHCARLPAYPHVSLFSLFLLLPSPILLPVYHLILHRKSQCSMSFLTSSSALHLILWLFEDSHLQMFCFDQSLLFAFRAVERIVFQNSILTYSVTGFVTANRAQYPFGVHIKPPFS